VPEGQVDGGCHEGRAEAHGDEVAGDVRSQLFGLWVETGAI